MRLGSRMIGVFEPAIEPAQLFAAQVDQRLRAEIDFADPRVVMPM